MKDKCDWLAVAALALLSICIVVAALAEGVDPPSVSVTHLRDATSISAISSVQYFKDTTLQINGTMYAGATTNASVQDLTSCVVTGSVGTASTNVDYAATIVDATAGTYRVNVTVPSFVSAPSYQAQVTYTNAGGNTNYIYQWFSISTKDAM